MALWKLRTIRGLTQRQLAELVGVSLRTICRWELAATLPTVTKAAEVARALGVDPGDIDWTEGRRGALP